jgi:ketopantoate reductase
MDQGDSNQGKYQTAYNASLKTLMALEDEQKVRLKESRDFVKREEAEEAMRQLMGEVLAVLDKLGLDCAEKCNPDNPAMAIKALESWVRSARNILSKDETQKDA